MVNVSKYTEVLDFSYDEPAFICGIIVF